MKLRIKGNSIRLRLTQGEVAQLAEAGRVNDAIRFGADSTLTYGIRVDAALDEAAVAYVDHAITISVPKTLADTWIGTDQVGFGAVQDLAAGETLRVLIEKDFKCLTDRAGEDESDQFPNPAERC